MGPLCGLVWGFHVGYVGVIGVGVCGGLYWTNVTFIGLLCVDLGGIYVPLCGFRWDLGCC